MRFRAWFGFGYIAATICLLVFDITTWWYGALLVVSLIVFLLVDARVERIEAARDAADRAEVDRILRNRAADGAAGHELTPDVDRRIRRRIADDTGRPEFYRDGIRW